MSDELNVEIGTEEEIAQAKSKFVKFPAGAKLHDKLFLKIQMQMPDWQTAGQSYQFPVVVTQEGENQGLEAVLYTGISKKGWKMIETLDNLKVAHPKNPQTGQVTFNRNNVAGIDAVGEWEMQTGINQSTQATFDMPKLVTIHGKDFKIPVKI
jgi:hypothetical protein